MVNNMVGLRCAVGPKAEAILPHLAEHS